MSNSTQLLNANKEKHQPKQETSFSIIGFTSTSHFLNDMMQSILLAIYPLIQLNLRLNFTEIGTISLTYYITSSLLQPLIGSYTDKYPKPFALPISMLFTLIGLLLLGNAHHYVSVLIAAIFIGMGSAVFHPEASRIVRLAAGNRRGLAQSLFQVGGNLGTAMGPLLALLIISPKGVHSVVWFGCAACFGAIVSTKISIWYRQQLQHYTPKTTQHKTSTFSKKRIVLTLVVLGSLMFSKFVYTASMGNYYTFYLIKKFHLSVDQAQLYLFAFLFAVGIGTVLGGAIGDKFGRKRVIWVSILGVAPLTMSLPYVGLIGCAILSVLIGLIMSSAFSAILVYAQELLPGKVGTISGLFFGLAFGIAGIAAALLGYLADKTSINYVFQCCAFLPLIGIVTIFLPDLHKSPTT